MNDWAAIRILIVLRIIFLKQIVNNSTKGNNLLNLVLTSKEDLIKIIWGELLGTSIYQIISLISEVNMFIDQKIKPKFQICTKETIKNFLT